MKKILLIGLMLFSLTTWAANPTVKITAPTDNLQAGVAATVTFTFSEPVSGFDITKIHVQGDGTLSAFTTVSTSVYTVTFTKTVDTSSASLVVDNNSYTAVSDATTGTYNAFGFNPIPIYYLARGGIFTNLKDRANPQPRCLLVGEELVNSVDNSPATRLVQRFFTQSKNSFKQIEQGCLIQPQSGQIVRKKLIPSAFEALTHQGAHNHSSLMPKASWQDVGRVQGFDRPRIKAANVQSCTPTGGNATTGVGQSYVGCTNNSGDFRIGIEPVRIDSDDPIVFPGQKGKAHLHVFFANTSTNYQSNNAILLNSKTSAAGGNVNKTAYWMPSMIDTATSTAILPFGGIFYYKTQDGMGFAEPIPQGLKGIAGNPAASGEVGRTDPIAFTCYHRPDVLVGAGHPQQMLAPAGMLGSIPACSGKYYNQMRAGVDFNPCLADDGTGKIKLDSPNHRDHWGGTPIAPLFANGCGVGFPHRIARIAQNVDYVIAPNQNTATWRLASDNYASTIPGGFSLHADYWGMWLKYWMAREVKNCGNMPADCGTNYIGLNDGITITSITTSGTLATVTTSIPHQLFQGEPKDYLSLKVRITGVTGVDANLYNIDPTLVTPNPAAASAGYGGTYPAGTLLPFGQQVIIPINATQFTYVLSAIPSAPGATKTGADLTSGTNYTGTGGALIQWGEVLCGSTASAYTNAGECPTAYSEFYHGTRQ